MPPAAGHRAETGPVLDIRTADGDEADGSAMTATGADVSGTAHPGRLTPPTDTVTGRIAAEPSKLDLSMSQMKAPVSCLSHSYPKYQKSQCRKTTCRHPV